jgi:hypothetical protein
MTRFGQLAVLMLSTTACEQPAASTSAAPSARPAPVSATKEPVNEPSSRSVEAPQLREIPDERRSDTSLQRVARAHVSEARVCWEKSRARSEPPLNAVVKVVLAFDVSSRGTVENAKATRGSDDYPQLAACLVREVSDWHFPEHVAFRVAELPFVFSDESGGTGKFVP